jgi:hypothetical protein
MLGPFRPLPSRTMSEKGRKRGEMQTQALLAIRLCRIKRAIIHFHPFVLPVITCELLCLEVKTQEARRGAKPGRWSCEVIEGPLIHNCNTRLSGTNGSADVSQETFAFHNLQYSAQKKSHDRVADASCFFVHSTKSSIVDGQAPTRH